MSKYRVRVNMMINAEASRVKHLIVDVLSYPTIFPFYKDVAHVSGDIYRMSAGMFGPFFMKYGKGYSWTSKFVFNNPNFILVSHELSPKEPVKKMTACWTLNNEGGICNIMLQHEFSIVELPPLIRDAVVKIIQIGIILNSKRLLTYISKATI